MEPKYANDPSYVFNLVKMKCLLFALSCIWTLGAQGQAGWRTAAKKHLLY
jgi:hypothetical protein